MMSCAMLCYVMPYCVTLCIVPFWYVMMSFMGLHACACLLTLETITSNVFSVYITRELFSWAAREPRPKMLKRTTTPKTLS